MSDNDPVILRELLRDADARAERAERELDEALAGGEGFWGRACARLLGQLAQQCAVVEALKTLYEYPPDCEACQEQRERGLHVFGYDVAKEFCMCEQHANEYRSAYDVAYPRPLTQPAAKETP